MHKQKEYFVATPRSIKIHHCTMNDNEDKGKYNLFCYLEFEITKTWKISSTWMHILQPWENKKP
jgi:hypothetical protein